MKNVRENSVESRLVSKLEERGIPCVKFIPDNLNGMPDRLVLLPDEKVVWVELKTIGGTKSKLQLYRHRKLRKAGQRVVTLWTAEQVDRFVAGITE